MMHSTQSDLEHLYRRLDEMRMSEHERQRAKAHLARAEALVELIRASAGVIVTMATSQFPLASACEDVVSNSTVGMGRSFPVSPARKHDDVSWARLATPGAH